MCFIVYTPKMTVKWQELNFVDSKHSCSDWVKVVVTFMNENGVLLGDV